MRIRSSVSPGTPTSCRPVRSTPGIPTRSSPRLRDGYLYGRGAADMKSSLAAFVVAIEQFVGAASRPSRLDRAADHFGRGRARRRRHGARRRAPARPRRDARLLRRRRAFVGRAPGRHDQERPPRDAVGQADRARRAGSRRLSASGAESDPSRRTGDRRAGGDTLGRRRRLLSADELAGVEHPRRHRCDQRHSRARSSSSSISAMRRCSTREDLEQRVRSRSWPGTASITSFAGPAPASRI